MTRHTVLNVKILSANVILGFSQTVLNLTMDIEASLDAAATRANGAFCVLGTKMDRVMIFNM
jgi:hypothetical protein